MKIGIDLGGSHIGLALIDNNIVEKVEIDLEKREDMEGYIMSILNYYIDKFVKNNNIELRGKDE